MNPKVHSGFKQFVERFLAPGVSALYILMFLVKVRDTVWSLGWRLSSVAILLLASAWAAYVMTAQEQTLIEPKTLVPRYGRRFRLTAVTLALLSLIPVILSVLPRKAPTIPPFMFWIANQSGEARGIKPHGEFFLTEPWSPATDVLVASGRIELRSGHLTQDSMLIIETNKEMIVSCDILNPEKFLSLYKRGDLLMRVVFLDDRNKPVTKDGVPFCLQAEINTIVMK